MNQESDEFRALYYSILHEQALIALKIACSQFPSVAFGHESLEDKITYYLEEAKSSVEMESFLEQTSNHSPPQRLVSWLQEKADAKVSEVSLSSSESTDS